MEDFHAIVISPHICFIDTSCAPEQTVTCLNNPCDYKHCPNIPNTVCVSKSCRVCSAHFYNTTGDDVTDMCSK